MSPWTWVLIALSAAGVVLAFVSVALVALAFVRLKKRIDAIRRSQLFLSVKSLQIQGERLRRTAERGRAVTNRSALAAQTMRDSVEHSGVTQTKTALADAGSDMQRLFVALR